MSGIPVVDRVSVIVPAYNAERYLRVAVESVVGQCDGAVEVLIVDDGSEDATWDVIRALSRAHDNVAGMRQARARQGAARNRALGLASGKFVQFLDADDLLPQGGLERMVAVAESHGSDIVAGIQESFSRRRRWVGVPVHRELFTRFLSNVGIVEQPALLQDISVCNRIFRRDWLVRTGLRFPEGTAGEDLEFMARAYLSTDRISVLPEVVYRYRATPGSRTGRIAPGFFEARVAVCEGLIPRFRHAGRDVELQVLLRSEARKLLGRRFERVLAEAPPGDRRQIMGVVGRLLTGVDLDPALESGEWAPVVQVRAVLLAHGERRALEVYEAAPRQRYFLAFLRDPAARARLLEPLFQLEQARGGASGWCGRLLGHTWIRRVRGGAGKVWHGLRAAVGAPPLLVLSYAWAGMRDSRRPDGNPEALNWLIDERISTSAEDSGFRLFRHLREDHPEHSAWFVLRRSSPHWAAVGGMQGVVAHGSPEHARLLRAADVLCSTDSFRSLDFRQGFGGRLGRAPCNVFLQHGVIGNKTTTYSRANYPYFDLVVVSSEREREFFVRDYGFRRDQMIVSGLPRFDDLPRPSSVRGRKILVAPTWRRWLRGSRRFEHSTYFRAWQRLLRDPALHALLDRHGVELVFRPHFVMMRSIGAFDAGHERVTIARDVSQPLADAIRESDVLVTDYSSVMYDFFYQEKPVVAYMFDRVAWEAHYPGPPHLNFDDELPVELCEEHAEVLTALNEVLERDITMTPDQLRQARGFFTFRGGGHSEAVVSGVVEYMRRHTVRGTA